MKHPTHRLGDPVPDRAIELKLEQLAAYQAPLPTGVCAELDRHDIAVVLQAVYKWGGYRYTNASDAIAAAKRGAK